MRALHHPGQRLAGPGLDEAAHARAVKRIDASRASAPGARAPPRAGRGSPPASVAERLRRAAREDGSRGRLDLDLARAPSRNGLDRGRHRRRCGRRRGPASSHRAHAARLRLAGGDLERLAAGPAATSWVGPLSLAITSAALGGGRAGLVAVAEQGDHPAGRSLGGRRCIRRPRTTASRTASAGSIAPAAASALSSPSEWPARNARLRPPGARSRRRGWRRRSPAARTRCPRRRARTGRRRPRSSDELEPARARGARRARACRASGCPGLGREARWASPDTSPLAARS